jgi:hypothetical protein
MIMDLSILVVEIMGKKAKAVEIRKSAGETWPPEISRHKEF